MKKFYYGLILFCIICSFFGFNLKLRNEQFFNFTIRYQFTTNISNLVAPSSIAKSRYKYFYLEFGKQNSNLNWFEPIKMDLNYETIILDIKQNYVLKKSYDKVTLPDLEILQLDSYQAYLLIILLNQNKPSHEIEKEVRIFCANQPDQFLYEKGIRKMIEF